jgi:hypothetical protein
MSIMAISIHILMHFKFKFFAGSLPKNTFKNRFPVHVPENFNLSSGQHRLFSTQTLRLSPISDSRHKAAGLV